MDKSKIKNSFDKCIEGKQEWPPKKVKIEKFDANTGHKIDIDENNPIWKEWMKILNK